MTNESNEQHDQLRQSAYPEPVGHVLHAHHELHEQHENLWLLAASPTIWAAHFMLAYVTAAIWCAKLLGAPQLLRALVIVYTLAALGGIAWVGLHGWRAHRYGDAELPHDFDSPADRHRFLGFARVLLSGLSAAAVLFAAFAALVPGSCNA